MAIITNMLSDMTDPGRIEKAYESDMSRRLKQVVRDRDLDLVEVMLEFGVPLNDDFENAIDEARNIRDTDNTFLIKLIEYRTKKLMEARQ